MSYKIPSHGKWCNACTYPTTCKICGAHVFYFTCNCGCKVFFDKLGPPWPVHACLKVDISKYFSIEPETLLNISIHRKKRKGKGKAYLGNIVSIFPRDESITEIGIVREISKDINLLKKFSAKEKSLGQQLLKGIMKTKPYQITIHSDNLCDDIVKSYTFFIDRKLFLKHSLVIGDLVEFKICGFEGLAHHQAFWQCNEISRL